MSKVGAVELSLVVPSHGGAIAEALGTIVREMRRHGLGAEWMFRVELSCQEALTNALVHGNRSDPEKSIRVSCCLSGEAVQIEVEDEGDGYDPAAVPAPSPTGHCGRGLYLIRTMMDAVSVNARGNAIRMRLGKNDRD